MVQKRRAKKCARLNLNVRRKTFIMSGKDPRVPRLEGELEQHLKEQLEMLADRCDSFYAGKTHEAKSAAAILYILLCDKGGSQKSLLGQLNLKSKHKFLDSRTRNQLSLNSAKGSWPWTVIPFKPHRNEDFVEFNGWWHQEFHAWFGDVTFTREELIEAIRHKEGGGHVADLTHEKIAAVRRSRSGWHRSIKEKEDGTTEMYVGVSLTNKPIPEDSDLEEISDYELACICAIAEEVLFSLTPEPDNRLRMQHPDYQQALYWTNEQSDKAKEVLKADILKLEEYKARKNAAEVSKIDVGINSIKNVLNIDTLTSEDYFVRRFVAQQLLRLDKFPWDANDTSE